VRPIRSASTPLAKRFPASAAKPTNESMTNVTSRACAGTSATVDPPGALSLDSGNEGAATM
jgi:hypothetical protein